MVYLKPAFWQTFFALLGTQNGAFGLPEPTPHRAHVWKTRIGFRTAWTVALVLHSDLPKDDQRQGEKSCSVICAGGRVTLADVAAPGDEPPPLPTACEHRYKMALRHTEDGKRWGMCVHCGTSAIFKESEADKWENKWGK